tara:strand:- start:364 stop:753 length:390 start_codon:yes stop_codon:yes gene_type:complete
MTYQMLGYDNEKGQYKSHQGYEPDICAQFEEGYGYYLYRGVANTYIVKLSEVWVNYCNDIGEIVTLQGQCIDKVPHPGVKNGEIMTSGLVSGAEGEFKFIVTPNSNQRQYFLSYNIAKKAFTGAGSSVR